MRPWTYLLCGILIVVPLSARSIDLKASGVMLGASWMNQKYEYSPNSEVSNPADDRISGPVVGAFTSVVLYRQWSAFLEAMYIRKGFEATFFATDETGPLGERTEEFSTGYLSLPVTIRLEFTSENATTYFFAGVGPEIRLSSGEHEFFDFLNKVNLGGHLGMGLGWGRFGVDIRYLRDLTSAADSTHSLESVINYGVAAALTYTIWGEE
jgi:hypothetical protein